MAARTAYEGVTPRRIPGATKENPVSISQLTEATKTVLESSFPGLWVSGEVSDMKKRNGHWYFCLRDNTARVSCVVWAGDQYRIPAAPDEGMKVLAFGGMTAWPAGGSMQFRIKRIEAEGDGLWRKALRISYNKLKAEGLLDPARKRVLPVAPRTVAVVTSAQGAALHDVIAVVKRRCPGTEVVLSACKVQGDGSAQDIVIALDRVLRWGSAEVVIIGRGGGSREDLWAFNDEQLARAIAGFPIPVIAAIGHETDTTLCDLVADHRAPTPSAAAEAAVPDMGQLRRTAIAFDRQMRSSIARRVRVARTQLTKTASTLSRNASRTVDTRRARIAGAGGHLNALSPLATLSRGYAVARSQEGTALTRRAQFGVGMPFNVRLADGTVPSVVAGEPEALTEP
ncbi:MAG: exodeoxyribonuclease VII large subunit [Gemmatimonadaceae bacterium]|nr:exodeoxyribonuclease VII large subunit [Gemmatimonadaceae bacterium]